MAVVNSRMAIGVPAWISATPRGKHLIGKGRSRASAPMPAPRREDAATAAQRAGDCGRSAPPVGHHRRIGSYHRQNGAAKLTPKQQRRANKKLKLELIAAAVYGTEAGVSL